jgi:sarcosine oxidase, subunit beta
MQVADVVIVGAGVNGASTAFHLADAGVRNVVVVERHHVAAGATGKSGALVRMHYTNEPETRLAFESLRYFQHWPEIVGGDCGFRPIGLLYFTPPQLLHHLEANVALQRVIGVNTRIIRPDEARELDPSLYLDDVTHIAYEPDSGYADPNATTQAFVRAAMQLGVEFLFETEVTAIQTAGDRVTGVTTSTGDIAAPVVVIVAGAWSDHLLMPLGIDLGLVAFTGRVTIFRWPMDRSPQHLTYIDVLNQLWARPIDANCTLVGAEVGLDHGVDPDHYAEAVPQRYIDLCRALIAKRFPVMQHAVVRGNSACVMVNSPDSRPIIDHLPQYQGLYCMAGCSGTSFKTAPAIGKCLSEWITEGRATTVDLTPFRSTRFADGKLWRDEHDYTVGQGTISR